MDILDDNDQEISFRNNECEGSGSLDDVIDQNHQQTSSSPTDDDNGSKTRTNTNHDGFQVRGNADHHVPFRSTPLKTDKDKKRTTKQASTLITPISKTNLDQEYNVDHSCSTPLERLARDIGNTFRKWHVHHGCDEHVSLDWAARMEIAAEQEEDDDGKQLQLRGNGYGDAVQAAPSAETANISLPSDVAMESNVINNSSPSPVECMSMDLCEKNFASRKRLWKGEKPDEATAKVLMANGIEVGQRSSSSSRKVLPQSPKAAQILKASGVSLGQRSPSNNNKVVPQSPRGRPWALTTPTKSKLISPLSESQRTPATKQTKRRDHGPSHHGARCIRSKTIQFQTMGYSSPASREDAEDDSSSIVPPVWERRRYTIPLVLKLWDAPSSSLEGTLQQKEVCERKDSDVDANIPKALLSSMISPSSYSLLGELGVLSSCGTQRVFYNDSSPASADDTNTDTMPSATNSNISYELPAGLTRDISSLFNIGQHISLCLDLSQHAGSSSSKNQNDVQSLYDDVHEYMEHILQEAINAQRQAVRERRRCVKMKQKKRRRDRMLRKRRETTAGSSDMSHGSQSMSAEESSVQEFHDGDLAHDDDAQKVGSEDGSGEYSNSDSDSSEDSDSMDDSNSLHLNQQEIHNEVTASLTSILQTALNLAASENECCIPVFGMWGDYRGDPGRNDVGNDNAGNKMSCIPVGMERNLLQIGDISATGDSSSTSYGHHDESQDEDDARQLLLSSPALSGTCQSGLFRSSHRLYYIPAQVLPLHLSTLNGLANVLLAQCHNNGSSGGKVVLTAARHCYHWKQPVIDREKNRNQDWRMNGFTSNDTDDTKTSPSTLVKVYQEKCRQQALRILERASSPLILYGNHVPIWGPSEGNPLLSLQASVSWGVMSEVSANEPRYGNTTSTAPASSKSSYPLLQLPLKIRSSNFDTESELLDMEYALQSAALNPIGSGVVENGEGIHDFGPREPTFLASAGFDMDAPCATLSANTRCVLAALIRCGSLGLDALPGHLTKKEIFTSFSSMAPSQDGGESSTRGTSKEELTDMEKILREALKLAKIGPVTERLIDALDWTEIEMDLSSADFDRAITEALQTVHSTTYPTPPVEVFSTNATSGDKRPRSQSKGSPPGRLLSVLYEHMARLRTPPSMMCLWLSFVEVLRTRWDHNESLPNLGYLPGLDDNSENDGDAYHADQPHWGLQKADTRVLGHRADHAAFVNSSEPDPDRNNCIINQKLEVYNICVECKLSTEALHEKQMHNDQENDDSVGSSDDEFFDPEEEEVTFEDKRQENRNIERMLMLQAAVMSPNYSNRIGARCPVPDGMPLIESGDQLYAPYLQRTMPMTDEEEQKRKKFLGVSKNTSKEERQPIKSRIAIAQRLQRPKLISDMSSFKAANNDAVFEDFVRWYGNPENPLSEEVNGETARRALEYRSTLAPAEAKILALEEASEAIAILMSLRAFWEDTWEEAEPCPAFDQEPLFDPYSTVEMVLHSFETIHPALLMNQLLAVKLSNARFVIESAASPARQVRSVAQGLANLKAVVDVALESLNRDAANGFLHLAPQNTTKNKDPLVYVSTQTITTCEEACNAIGELEILLSRALSLIEKFPDDHDLVDSLLQCKHGKFLFVKCPRERSTFLSAIKYHTEMNLDSSCYVGPAMKEYVLGNLDPLNQCQISARLIPNFEKGQPASLIHESLLMALTKNTST